MIKSPTYGDFLTVGFCRIWAYMLSVAFLYGAGEGEVSPVISAIAVAGISERVERLQYKVIELWSGKQSMM